MKIKRLDFLSIILILVIIFQINICPLSNLQTSNNSDSKTNENAELQPFFSYPNDIISNSTDIIASKIQTNSDSNSEDGVESFSIGSTKTFWVENFKYANDDIDNDGNGKDFQQGDWHHLNPKFCVVKR